MSLGYLRAVLFQAGMVVATLVWAPLSLLTFPFPFRVRYYFITQWSRFNTGWLTLTCGVRYRVTGREHLNRTEPAVVLSKHESTWEVLALEGILPPKVWVLKRELLGIPLFGWALRLLKPIAIDRAAGKAAMEAIVEQGRERLAQGIWVVVFPEGTRTRPGEKVKYRAGGALLATRTGYPVLPIAHNSGDFWQQGRFVKRPGVVDVVIGPPIPSAGRRHQDVLAEAERWIETTTARIRAGQPAA
jgi:1-acyl-sn-glycerol-3-phosphate acyltransferase